MWKFFLSKEQPIKLLEKSIDILDKTIQIQAEQHRILAEIHEKASSMEIYSKETMKLNENSWVTLEYIDDISNLTKEISKTINDLTFLLKVNREKRQQYYNNLELAEMKAEFWDVKSKIVY